MSRHTYTTERCACGCGSDEDDRYMYYDEDLQLYFVNEKHAIDYDNTRAELLVESTVDR